MRFLLWILWFVILVALIATGLGGALDIIENGRITKEHAWNDGLFLMLFAIFLSVVTKS